ncbi:MAG: AraC family transcriptional regulator ligand-binding domain-containing protein [Myxococcales bacterium]|nr:AraC family transcriptional regulator ligand-binding domain-containing protein [Myxococcales bacterium]
MEGTLAVTSGIGALELLLDALPSFGLDGAELGRSVGMDIGSILRHGRLSVAVETAIWDLAAARLPELPLGISVAERCFTLGLHERSLYEFLGCFAPTLREAAAAMRARQRLETDAFVTSFREDEGACVVRTDLVFPRVAVSYERIEFGMLRTLKEARRLSGQPLVPTRVTLRREVSSHLHAYGRAFGVAVELGSECDQMVFAPGSFDFQLVRANPVLFAEMKDIADGKLATMAPVELWAVLEAAIERMLPTGDFSMASVACWMGMTAEALQRLVHGRGQSWTAVVDRVRRRIAELLLRDLELPISSVGYRVGFANPASFTRAFRRWTGMTPEAYRR